MKPLNILFSTTRQWNCGDEFILFGVRRLLNALDTPYNAIIYNRHPSITPRQIKSKSIWGRKTYVTHLDNSFILDEARLIDYVIFAGSPEWFGGPRINPLLKYILDKNLRCAFLGVGVHRQREFSDVLKKVLTERCDLITARDPVCYDSIKEYPNSYYEVCPALFSAPYNRLRTSIKKIGVVLQAGKSEQIVLQTVPENIIRGCHDQISRLEKEVPVTFIAHHINDLKFLEKAGKDALYSGYAEDYCRMFDRFDVILSTRVHGCGMASSLGIPNALIPHDGRYQTALKFKSFIVQPGTDFVEWAKSLDVQAVSAELIAYRAAREQAYRELLLKHLSILD